MTEETQPKRKNYTWFWLLFALSVACLIFIGWPRTENSQNATPQTIRYVCGYSRCTGALDYGQKLFDTGINTWNAPDPNRGGVHHQVSHGDRLIISDVTYVGDRTWYEIEGGGWLSDLWLTKQPCTQDNLEEYSLDDC